ncbi:MAG: hypothetical protein HYS22_03300 [Deltaproteobacteria bacterium]|nr:hypothetical protein [Deltaproteobacteria bacterium]
MGIRVEEKAVGPLRAALASAPEPVVRSFAPAFGDGVLEIREVTNLLVFQDRAVSFMRLLEGRFGPTIEASEVPRIPPFIRDTVASLSRQAALPSDTPSGKPFYCRRPVSFGVPESSPDLAVSQQAVSRLESSGIAYYRDHFLVVDDKSNDIFVFNQALSLVAVVSGGAFGRDVRKFEDIAVEDDWIYVVGDYANKGKGKGAVENHSLGFKFRFSPGDDPTAWAIMESEPFYLLLDPSLGWDRDPEKNGLKVEGLAVHNGLLYLGVRVSAVSTRDLQILKALPATAERQGGVLLEPYLPPFPTGVIASLPDRPLQLSSLQIDHGSGDMFILLSAASSSQWMDLNETPAERFVGNRLLRWNLNWSFRSKRPEVVSEVFHTGSKAEGVALGPLFPDGHRRGVLIVYDNDVALTGWPSQWSFCEIPWPL